MYIKYKINIKFKHKYINRDNNNRDKGEQVKDISVNGTSGDTDRVSTIISSDREHIIHNKRDKFRGKIRSEHDSGAFTIKDNKWVYKQGKISMMGTVNIIKCINGIRDMYRGITIDSIYIISVYIYKRCNMGKLKNHPFHIVEKTM